MTATTETIKKRDDGVAPMRNVAFLLIALMAAGCLTGTPPPDEGAGDDATPTVDHLTAEGAETLDEDVNRTFVWQGDLGAGAYLPLGGPAPDSDSTQHVIPVDENVSVLVVSLDASAGAVAVVRDADDHVRCAPRDGRICTVDVNESAEWVVTVTSVAPEGTSFTLRATVSPLPPVYGIDGTPAASYAVEEAGVRGGEPTLAVLEDGRVLVVAGNSVLRWEGPGSWTDVTPPADEAGGITLDPFLVGDPVTGRVYVSQLAACQRVSWTDDAGDSWTSNPLACGGPDQHHQKLDVGPGPTGRAVHMMTMNLASWLATDDTVVTHAASHDGGFSWLQSVALTESVHGFEARAIGNVATSEEGTVHAIAYLCDGFVDANYHGLGVGRSTDGGATWSWQQIAPGGGPCEGIDPGIAAVGSSVHAAWWDASDGSFRLWYAASDDAGAMWSEPVAIPTPGLTSFVFADAAATDERVAVAFFGTPDSAVGANQAPSWSRWFPYLATRAADGGNWTVERLEDHPIQLGQICMDGPQCLDGARNLLDFIDVQFGPEGRIHVAYPDGCDADCTANWQSRDAALRIAIEPVA